MLKQLRINAKLKELRRSLGEYLEKQAGFNSRAAELQKALEEAENQSDLDLINQNIEELDKEVKEADCENNIEKFEVNELAALIHLINYAKKDGKFIYDIKKEIFLSLLNYYI